MPGDKLNWTYMKRVTTGWVLLSLCVYWYFLMLPQPETPRHYDGNQANLYLFSHYSHRALIDTNFEAQFPAFKPRIAGQVLAGKWLDATSDGIWNFEYNGYCFPCWQVAFGLYQAFWLGLLFGVVWWFRPDDAILVCLITYGSLTYNLTEPSGSWFFPFDMPILALFNWAFLAWEAGCRSLFVVVAVVACAFKETGLVLFLLPLLERKLVMAALVFSLGLLVRWLLMDYYRVNTMLLPFNESSGTLEFIRKAWQQFRNNCLEMGRLNLNNFIWTNCGLVVMGLFLKAKWQTKALVGAFLTGQWFAGTCIEPRDFYEIAPLTACIVADNLQAPSKNVARTKAGPS